MAEKIIFFENKGNDLDERNCIIKSFTHIVLEEKKFSSIIFYINQQLDYTILFTNLEKYEIKYQYNASQAKISIDDNYAILVGWVFKKYLTHSIFT